MRGRQIAKRILAGSLSALLVLTGIQYPIISAKADPDPPSEVLQRNVTLPLELYDYQADGLLFEYILGDLWTGTNDIQHSNFWGALSAAARADLANARTVSENTYNHNDVQIIEGLVKNTDQNGLEYKDGTKELFAWYVLNTLTDEFKTYPLVDEEDPVSTTYQFGGNTYNWNFDDYRIYSVDDELNRFAGVLEGDVALEEMGDYAHYKMYYEDHYTYDNQGSNRGVVLCDFYYKYYVAKVQNRVMARREEQLVRDQEIAKDSVDLDNGAYRAVREAAERILGVVKSAVDAYNAYTAYDGTAAPGADYIDQSTLPALWRLTPGYRYYYGETDAALEDAGFTNIGLTGILESENSAEYKEDLERAQTILNDYPGLLDVIREYEKGRVISSTDTRILDGEDTWNAYYPVESFVPGFDYLYQHMAYDITTAPVYNGFSGWHMPVVQTKAEESVMTPEFDVTDETRYHVQWIGRAHALEFGQDGYAGREGAKRTFSLPAGTYTMNWSVERAAAGLLVTDGTGAALDSTVDHVVGIGKNQTASFTLEEPTDVTVLFYYDGTDTTYSRITNFTMQDSSGAYMTKNDSYGEFFDPAVPYRWAGVVDTDGDGVYEKPVAFDSIVDFNQANNLKGIFSNPVTTEYFYGYHPLEIRGDIQGKATITIPNLDPDKIYELSYGQLAYNNGKGHLSPTGNARGTMVAELTGAMVDMASIVMQDGGIMYEETVDGIRTVFNATSYNIDNQPGMTTYQFMPSGDTVTITFSTEQTASTNNEVYFGWINGFELNCVDDGTTLFSVSPTNTGTSGWEAALAGNDTSGVTVTPGYDAVYTYSYYDTDGVVQQPVPGIGGTDEFQTDGTTLKINGDNGGDQACSPFFNMDMREPYELTYEMRVNTISADGPAMSFDMESADGDVLYQFPLRSAAVCTQDALGNWSAGLGAVKVTDVQQEGDAYWISISYPFTAFVTSARFVVPDAGIMNENGFEIRNLRVMPKSNQAYVYGSAAEAEAAEAYVQTQLLTDPAERGIRKLVDAFVAYHQSQNDGTLIGDTGRYGMTAYDYVNYMLDHLFDRQNMANVPVDEFDNLILEPAREITTVTSKKTGDTYDLATYGFYATALGNENGVRNSAKVVYTPRVETTKGTIRNSFEGSDADARDQLFPINKGRGEGFTDPVDNGLYFDNNYHYTMHSGGRFVYHKADNLVFMFTGDDDVYLFLNDRLALDLGGAHTAYNDYIFVNDMAEELGLEENGVYNFDFYYMERHTTVAQLKVLTNINVMRADAILTKGAKGSYYTQTETGWQLVDDNAAEADRNIPNGSAVPEGEKEYYLTLLGGMVPLVNLRFDDDVLGVHIGAQKQECDPSTGRAQPVSGADAAAQVTIGETTYAADAVVPGVTITVTNRVDGVSSTNTYTNQTAGQIIQLLETGISADGSITISGLTEEITSGVTNAATAQALVDDFETNQHLLTGDVKEVVDVNRAHHSMNVAEQYYVEGNAANHENGVELQGIFENEDFNGKSFAQLTTEEKNALHFRAFDAAGNDLTQPRTVDGTVIPPAVVYDTTTAVPTLKFYPENLTASDSGSAYTTTIYYDFDAAVTINDMLYASNPVPVTIHVYALNDDVYVLDYGLYVKLTGGSGDLFANDKYRIVTDPETPEYVEFPGILDGSTYKNTGFVNSTRGRIVMNSPAVNLATYTPENPNGTIQYRPKGTKLLEGIDRFAYGVDVKDTADAETDGKHGIRMNANITVMPASIVYYEDNFATTITNATNLATVDFLTNGTKKTGTGAYARNTYQSNDNTTQYGYDAAYADDGATYYNGNHTILAANQSIAFTFTGTGFDILTRTSDANLYVSVYDARDFELASYSYNDTTILYAKKKDGAPADAKVLKTTYINAYNENFKDGIHQIPLISLDLTEVKDANNQRVKQFLVIATKTTGAEAVWIDGIRIYNPLGVGFDGLETEAERAEAAAAYGQAEGELNATIQDVRAMILGKNYQFKSDATQTSGNGSVAQNPEGRDDYQASLVQFVDGRIDFTNGKCVVECYTGTVDSRTIDAERVDRPDRSASLLSYAISGPNNELYLDDEQYVFATVLSGVTTANAEQVTLQLGLKAVQGSAKIAYLAADKTWKALPSADNLASQNEMYYKVPVADLWSANESSNKVLMLRAEFVDGSTDPYVISMTNVKYAGFTGTMGFEPPTANTFVDADLVENVVTQNDQTRTFEILSSNSTESRTTLTISVPAGITDFTIRNADDNANALDFTFYTVTGAKVFGYASGITGAENVTVRQRVGNDTEIYVIQFKTIGGAVLSGEYVISSVSSGGYGRTTFTIQ